MKVIDTIGKMTFEESEFQRGKEVWKAETLYLFAKAKEYPILDLPLWCIDLSDTPFNAEDLQNFIFQCKRVQDTSLEYPIILDNYGQIADGYHRICKAILEGRETIKAIRLEEMPAPDKYEK